MARDNEPWVKLKIGARRSGKIAGLPSDSARLGYFYLLLEAKVQRHMGVFDSRAHFVEVLGRFGRYLPDYIAAGLAHEVPAMCPECKRRNTQAKRGEIVVHDFQREQRDPTNAARQAEWRDRQRDESNGVDNGAVTGNVTPEVTDPVTPTVTVDSRAPESTATVTVTVDVPSRSTKRGAPAGDDEGPLLSRAQLDTWRSFGSEWDAFKAAWLDRGLKLPPSGEPDEEGSQRATLHPIVDDWPNDVAGWVRSAPKGASGRDIVGHVISCYREATAGVTDAVPDWMGGPSKGEAAETVGAILGRMAS